MHIEHIIENGIHLAVVSSDEKVVTSTESALDMAMTVRHETGASRIALSKTLFAEEFFILSSGMAGEILQKFITYQIKAAIWGDYSRYTSVPLKSFIYESNQGNDFFFVASKEEAIEKLAQAL